MTRKPSSKPSVSDKPRYSTTADRSSSGKQKVGNENHSKVKKDNPSKDLPKSLSTSTLKSLHLSKSSPHVPKKNSSDSKDPGILSSSKDSDNSANSLRCESGGGHEQNKSTLESSQKGEKISQINRQPVTKNISDEELALLLH
ncbi:hypothetical protein L2E82_28727 [Cichorium intybus]|uniref:Uncharacterized protein n=1 Tax=Cichorium intybus TaxID=13427 RepID=A0ACB9CWI2_CICIN|nr:hypothetical protein L2E82_28727 [Cichorium intybus]